MVHQRKHTLLKHILLGVDEESMKRSVVEMDKRLAAKPDNYYRYVSGNGGLAMLRLRAHF